ncbi:hypothetical protein ACKI18_28910 [Streptomyces niveiscabiei]|uniref:Mobilization protein n=1 Tax=Streptomyces niveiscabiei TaxID=164115 RepID=A0ABW9I0B1_9ACTN
MGKPDTKRVDREIESTRRKLEAVRNEELWPLTGPEKRAVLRALAGGSYRVMRGKDTGRQEQRLDTLLVSVQSRLNTELAALEKARQRILTEHAQANAAKKSSGWW